MAYATTADMVQAFGETEMIRLTTPEGQDLAGIVVDRSDARLRTASSLMDSYLGRRYGLPLAAVPEVAVQCCMELARHDLMFQGARQPTEPARLVRKGWIDWLVTIAEGKADLPGMDPVGATPPGAASAGGSSGARARDRAPAICAGGQIGW